jgi:hypothetical protein
MSDVLKLLQWNILVDNDAPGCIDAGMREYVQKECGSASCLDWAQRKHAIAMRVSCADVAYLEECSPKMLESLRPLLPDFDSWHAAELVDADHDEQEIALLVRRGSVELVGAPRCQRLHTVFADGCAEQRAMLVAAQEGENVPPSSYAVLSAAVKRTGWSAHVVLAATHLRWEYFGGDPRFEAGARAKPLQALAAARVACAHAAEAGAAGWSLCGDFNAGRGSGVHALLTDGALPAVHPEHPGGELAAALEMPGGRMQSAFAAVTGAEPRFTRKKNTVGTQFCLDYVFLAGALRATAVGFGPGPAPFAPGGDGSDLRFLPCEAWPSDHLPLVADLTI